MTILWITAGLIQIAPPQMAPWVLGILIDLWTIPARCWMILWSAGCLVIIWFHGALSDPPVSWPSWSNGGLSFFSAVYFWFLVGWGTCVLYWGAHVVTSLWEFTQILRLFMLFLPLGGPITCVSRQLLVSSTDPTAYQFRLACAPTPWMGRKKGPDHTDWPDWWSACSCFEMPRASISICYICWADRMSKQMLCLDWGRQYR